MTRALGFLGVSLRRFLGGLFLLVGATFLIYMTIRSAPGDAIDAITPMGTPPDVKAKLMAEFGLDKDPVSGYLSWLTHSAVGDFGESLVVSPGEPVMSVALGAFGQTLLLAVTALLVCLILALGGAALSTRSKGRGQLGSGFLYVITSAPSFVVAIFFMLILNWSVFTFLEQGGYVVPDWYPIPVYTDSYMPFVFAVLALVFGDGLFMEYFNSTRAELTAVQDAQFISAIKAKGASTTSHVVRNMLVPVAAGYSARLPVVLGGAVIVEYVFTLEGAGYLLLEAAKVRDFPVVVGLSVLFTAVIIGVTVLADMVRGAIDPREVSHGG